MSYHEPERRAVNPDGSDVTPADAAPPADGWRALAGDRLARILQLEVEVAALRQQRDRWRQLAKSKHDREWGVEPAPVHVPYTQRVEIMRPEPNGSFSIDEYEIAGDCDRILVNIDRAIGGERVVYGFSEKGRGHNSRDGRLVRQERNVILWSGTSALSTPAATPDAAGAKEMP